ncbi:MAG: hypothetical protein Q9182_000423 [Xanthomendoza sp. 2 TL-2023]
MAPLARMIPSFGGPGPRTAAPSSSNPSSRSQQPPHSSLGGKGLIGSGGKTGLGGKGLGKGKGGLKRHRRLARRGGVKRISGGIYDDVRKAMTDRLKLVSPLQSSMIQDSNEPTTFHQILRDCVIFLEHSQRKSKF